MIIPCTERFLRINWDNILMVDQAGRYYVTLFKFHQGISQVDLLSIIIFNMVLDSVVCFWVTMVAVDEALPEGSG